MADNGRQAGRQARRIVYPASPANVYRREKWVVAVRRDAPIAIGAERVCLAPETFTSLISAYLGLSNAHHLAA